MIGLERSDAAAGGRSPWRPRKALLTRSAAALPRGRAMAERAAALGAEIVELKGDRLIGVASGAADPSAADPRAAYREAKATLAITTASPSRRRLQPIPPSADWRFDLAEGCPAHCQYCYLAGSLSGPPLIRAYANLEDIFAQLPPALGEGRVTSASDARAGEGTTFEASCYTDPLGIEHVTGTLAETVAHFGRWEAAAQLRFTTKFAAVEPLLALEHRGGTRVRLSVNAPGLVRFEGGTDTLQARFDALRRLAAAGYKVGLTVAPIQPLGDWRADYRDLFRMAATALSDVPDVDLTVEFITHRFTPKSKAVLRDWYPGSALDLDEAGRTRKLTKFGSVKHVYPAPTMKELRRELNAALREELPGAKVLYWT